MKTISFNGPNKHFGKVFFVLAALGGLYYMRRQGKSMSSLLTAGTAGLKAAQDLVGRVAPSVASGMRSGASRSTDSVTSSAQI
jgi:hypothetical protein